MGNFQKKKLKKKKINWIWSQNTGIIGCSPRIKLIDVSLWIRNVTYESRIGRDWYDCRTSTINKRCHLTSIEASLLSSSGFFLPALTWFTPQKKNIASWELITIENRISCIIFRLGNFSFNSILELNSLKLFCVRISY